MHSIFTKPANFIFLLLQVFLARLCCYQNWKYALLGASFFGLSTYFYIIIAAGHNGKVATLVYFAPFSQEFYWFIFVKIHSGLLSRHFYGIANLCQPPTNDVLSFLALGFLFLSELIRAATGKQKHFFYFFGSSRVCINLGVGMNSQRLWPILNM